MSGRGGELRQRFEGIEFEYGMNAPEPGWIWSTNDFGFNVSSPSKYVVIQAQTFRDAGSIEVHSAQLGSRRYMLSKGRFRVVLDGGDQDYQFQIRPKLSYASDVRELGIMIEDIWLFDGDEQLKLYRKSVKAAELAPLESDFIPSQRRETEGRLVEHVYRSFVDGGWANATLHRNHLRLSLVPPRAFSPSEALRREIVFNGETHSREFRKFASPASRVQAATLYCDLDIAELTGRTFENCTFDVHLPGHEWQSHHWRGFGAEPLPDADNIVRIAGFVSAQSFCFTGATWQTKLERLIRTHMGIDVSEIGDVLDWGCGCARISRFFGTGLRDRLYGADIDAVNIRWCQSNIAAAEWSVVSTVPPMPYPDGKFSLVFGHSVFTHIAEEEQFEWLAELSRILKPGGLCLVTVNAELSMFSRFYPEGRPASSLAEYLSHGFMDDGWLDIGVDASAPGSYRTVTHGTEYILTRWGQHFEIVTLMPGFADLQTLVVLRKRG